jgi:hypothetical protein
MPYHRVAFECVLWHRHGACGHVFGFRGSHSNWYGHGRVGFDQSAIVNDHISNCRAASVWAVLPAGIGKYGQIGVWYAVFAAYVIDRVGSGV